MDVPWRIDLLGGLRVQRGDGSPVRLQKQKAGALLAYLAYYPQPHPREALVDVFWPEIHPDAGRNSLRVALHSLRRELEPQSEPAQSLVLADRRTIGLRPERFTTDVAEREAALRDALQSADPARRRASLARAVHLYRGDLLPQEPEGWLLTERPRLLERHLEALRLLAASWEQEGELERAIQCARQAVSADPLREEAHYELMRLYALAGQPTATLQQYQELERRLREELGETPSAATRALAEELRESARTVVAARSASGAMPGAGYRRPRSEEPSPSTRHAAPSTPPEERFPVQLTRFFGREEEIARLTELLSSPATRLVTVTGPGGSGKTRLAIAAAARLVGAGADVSPFEEAVAFVSLEGLADAARIPDAVADALGLIRSPGVEVLEQVIERLRERAWLLLLDNYEHLVEEGALWVRRLLERAPALTCLLTSRQRLGLRGEQEFTLLPLPTPRRGARPEQIGAYASVQLFVDRARGVRGDFDLTPENAPAVAELCDRLEGLPLAIELAAARAAVLPPQQMLAELEQRFAFLVSRERDVPRRHRTLRAAIESSYELLDAELRRFFAQLSVFRGGWTLEAARAVCEQPRALDYLEHLRDCSLLTTVEEQGGEARYRLLETVREYAEEQLAASGERAATRRRYRAWYLQLAGEAAAAVDLPAQKAWLSRLEVELDNLRAALQGCRDAARDEPDAAETGLRLAEALLGFWIGRGYLAEGIDWIEGALQRSAAISASMRAEAFGSMAHLASHLGDEERVLAFRQAARREYETMLANARNADNRREIAQALVSLAHWCHRLLDLDAAWSYGVEARQHLERLEGPAGRARANEALVGIALKRRDRPAARALLEEHLAFCRKQGSAFGLSHALGAMGHLRRDEGDFEGARACYRESLVLRRELGHLIAHAQALEDLAVLAGRQGQVERAVRLLGAEEAFCEPLGIRPPVADAETYERTVAGAQAALGEARFAALRAEGRAMSPDAATRYALEEPPDRALPAERA
jgi:predicted ATPase/DNA-binding SARP family transcriptional activator